jgi:hypothetical protein
LNLNENRHISPKRGESKCYDCHISDRKKSII